MRQWFYISFADHAGHRGSTVVEATSAGAAIVEATRRGLNPGGEAQIVPVPAERSDHPDLVGCRNRLVGKAELLARGAVRRGYHENAEVVCQDCNQQT